MAKENKKSKKKNVEQHSDEPTQSLSEVKGMIENPEQDVLKARERMEKEYQP